MTDRESDAPEDAPDAPFPGAHPQVPGMHRLAPGANSEGASVARVLPLGGAVLPRGQGWMIRLPVRAEEVVPARELVVYERVTVRRDTIHDVERLDSSVRREVLRVDASDAPRRGRHDQTAP